jgi:hypothetical protein
MEWMRHVSFVIQYWGLMSVREWSEALIGGKIGTYLDTHVHE